MKRIISVLCVMALVLSMLAACGSGAPVATTPTEEPVQETTEEVVRETEEAVEALTVRLGALTGPTAISMVKAWHDGGAADAGIRYEHTLAGSADELTPLILQGELDIASIPANLASVLYNKTEGGVKVIAVNVLGVLYLCEYGSEEIMSVADLKGKTIYATGKGSTPEYFLRYILTQNGLDPDKDVTMEWKSEPTEVIAQLNADGKGVAMIPEPQASAAGAKLGEGFRRALSVSEEWEKVGNGSPCTTAVTVVRSDFAQEHPEAVEAFLKEYVASADWLNNNVGEAVQYIQELEILPLAAPVLEKAIPKCNVTCIIGEEMKEALGGCLGVLFEQNPKAVGGALPQDDFYYGA